MKKISLILLLFLLPLCLIPSTSAVYGDESPDSITSFSETLPDDVLYYPDSFVTSIELADYGEISDESYSADYILTHVKDGSAFNETTATDIEIWFEVDTTDGFEGFSYAHYLNVDSGTDVDLAAYDFDQDFFVKIDEPVPSSYAWMNGTIYDPDYWNTTHIAFTMYELSGNADMYWDYGEITLHRMTLADSDHYAEGFNDVSDWSVVAGLSPTTDEDLLTLSHNGDSDWDSIESVIPSLSSESYYIEFRAKWNQSGTALIVYITVNEQDDFSGATSAPFGYLYFGTAWITYRELVSQSIENIRIGYHADSAVGLLIDYMRIAPANESGGWQHDGSTTEGVTNPASADMDYYLSTDGDILNITVDQVVVGVGVGAFQTLVYDTTTTVIDMDRDYYSFFVMRYRVTKAISCTPYVRVYIEGAYSMKYFDLSGDWIIMRMNLNDKSTHGSIGIWLSAYMNHIQDVFSLDIDYAKIYSIANFTVSDVDDETMDNYLYVDSGNLICSDTIDYIRLQYDPSISIANNIYAVWNATVSSGAEYFRFRDYGDGTYYDQGETSGLISSTIMGGFQILFYGGLDLDAITFIDVRDWQEIGEVEFVIPVGWDPTFIFGYDAFFIFLGLILIPVSTMYLVRGGREEASADKVFYFLIMFMIGFGLLVGGIMP